MPEKWYCSKDPVHAHLWVERRQEGGGIGHAPKSIGYCGRDADLPEEKEAHVVAKYQIHGVQVLISDEAYSGKTEAELEQIRYHARQIAWKIHLAYEKSRETEEEIP